MSKNNDERRNWHGGHWIRAERRLAIYLRDGLACVWCRRGIETHDELRLSLDHLKTNRDGGSNESANLVTACTECNSARAHRSVKAWARSLAALLTAGITDPDEFERYARACARRPVPLAEAKRIIAERIQQKLQWKNGFLCDQNGAPLLLVMNQPPRILKLKPTF